jgi:hypothetical protein
LGLSTLPGCPEPEAAYDRPEPHKIVRANFSGEFYVDGDTTDFKIVERVRKETKSSLVALRKAKVVIASKGDLAGLDINRVTKEPITVIDPATSKRHPAIRVRFRYVDQAVVPASMVGRNIVQIPLLQREDESLAAGILSDCMPEGAPKARDPMKTLVEQYDPTTASCKAAMNAEQQTIEAARLALVNPKVEIVPAELERVYAPLVASLTSLDPGGAQEVAPSYEQVEPGSGEPAQPGGPSNTPPSGKPGDPAAAATPGAAGTAGPALKPVAPLEGGAERRAKASAAATAAANVETVKAGGKPPPRSNEIESEPLDFSMLSDPRFLLVGVALLALFPLLRKSKK